MRISGEVNVSNRSLLHRVLLSRAAVRSQVHLDLEKLTFADVGALARLRAVAAGLPDEGWLMLDRAPAVVRRALDLCALTHERLRVTS